MVRCLLVNKFNFSIEFAMELEELEVYNEANQIADMIWKIVINWEYFQKDTIGKQIIKSVDSISANISEGYGRYFHKENLQFCYYSRGSLYETKTWLFKASNRDLISKDDYKCINEKLIILQRKLNGYIKFLRNNDPKNSQS